ncbi:hypothetical protein [Maribacter sp. 2-571]|uniref:hypothetical protein n=1 Tax=Maribacter sp. 2-571 TaxID=3417569 RepID=UPI003D355FE1
MHIRIAGIVLSLLFLGCAAHKAKYQEAALSLPQMGSIVQTKGALWFSISEQVGDPIWSTPLAVTAQELPFNNASYTTYTDFMIKAGKINGIAYQDSLPYKPKYARLQLLDKIDLTGRLNSKENIAVREFLKNDDSYKIVTTLDVTMPDALLQQFLNANTISLRENTPLGRHLVLVHDKRETTVPFSEIQVFDYAYASFCWGEDRYHHKRIETLLSGSQKCPKGTFKKAAKVTSDRAYLKF